MVRSVVLTPFTLYAPPEAICCAHAISREAFSLSFTMARTRSARFPWDLLTPEDVVSLNPPYSFASAWPFPPTFLSQMPISFGFGKKVCLASSPQRFPFFHNLLRNLSQVTVYALQHYGSSLAHYISFSFVIDRVAGSPSPFLLRRFEWLFSSCPVNQELFLSFLTPLDFLSRFSVFFTDILFWNRIICCLPLATLFFSPQDPHPSEL